MLEDKLTLHADGKTLQHMTVTENSVLSQILYFRDKLYYCNRTFTLFLNNFRKLKYNKSCIRLR